MALITMNGLKNLRAKIQDLQLEESKALESITIARGYGDFSENAELEAARNHLDYIQKNISILRKELENAQVFDINMVNKEVIGFGATVYLVDDNDKKYQYTFVHNDEADFSLNKISINSPLAQAMIGKKINETFSFYPPAGEKNFTILDIVYEGL